MRISSLTLPNWTNSKALKFQAPEYYLCALFSMLTKKIQILDRKQIRLNNQVMFFLHKNSKYKTGHSGWDRTSVAEYM